MITSVSNPAVKEVVRLHKKSERKDTGLFIVEGLRALETVIKAGLVPDKAYCTLENQEQLKDMVAASSLVVVSNHVMQKMSTSSTPSGFLGVFRQPNSPDKDTLSPGLVLAQIQDPGNMGTLIRTAVACGLSSIVIVEGVDPFSPKVVQASAGTVASLSLFHWDWDTLLRNKRELKLIGLVVEGGGSVKTVSSSDSLIVVGNEASGIPKEWLNDCDHLVTLPMPGKTESLNAAVAGSIALYLAFVVKI